MLSSESKGCKVRKMASQADQIAAASTLTELAKIFKVEDQLWADIKSRMGDPTFEEVDLAARIPGATWEDAILSVSPSAVLKNIRVAALINAVFKKQQKEEYNFFKPKPVAEVPQTTAIEKVTTPSEDKYAVKVKLSKVVDQNLDQEIPLLAQDEIMIRRKRFEDWNRQPPLPLEQNQ